MAAVQSTTAAEVQLFAGATAAAAASNGQGATSDSGRGAESGGAGQAVSVDTRLEKIRLELDQQINQGLVAVEKVGDAIMIRLEGQGSFISGSADLQPQFMSLLARVGRTVSDSKGGIRIEGHTDNVPIGFSDRFKSNWDLSAARSASVASYITGSGIDQERVTVAGFADTRPHPKPQNPETLKLFLNSLNEKEKIFINIIKNERYYMYNSKSKKLRTANGRGFHVGSHSCHHDCYFLCLYSNDDNDI